MYFAEPVQILDIIFYLHMLYEYLKMDESSHSNLSLHNCASFSHWVIEKNCFPITLKKILSTKLAY